MKWPWQKKPKTRSFAGAQFNRLTADWIAMNTSVDSEIKGSLPALRARSRQLGRDNDYARSLFRDIQVNVVGPGVIFQSQIMKQRGGKLDEEVNYAVESAWYRWTRKQYCDVAGKLSFSDMERLAIRSVVESGEIFFRKVTQMFGGSKVSLGLEVIESDLVDDNYNGIEPNGNAVRMGVEINEWGRPVAYHILKKHPGDYQFGMGARQERARERVRVPANEIIHLFISERPGQTRGVPWAAAAITRLRHMGGYEEAEVIAARASAALMGFIETPEGQLQGDDVDAGQRVSEFEPGVFKQMNPGEKVNVPNIDRPGGQFDPFMRMMLRGVAASVGVSYEGISSDYSQSNYSSTRQALVSVRDFYKIIQKWMVENFHQQIFETWLDMATLSGAVSIPKFNLISEEIYESCKWQPRGWAWIDPEKEVAANRDAVAAGFKTHQDVIGDMGGDFYEVISNRKREEKLIAEAGLKFETSAQVETLLMKQAPPSGAAKV